MEPAPRTAPTRAATFGADFDNKLDAITHTKTRPGNRIDLLFDGKESFAAREELIKSAKRTIHLQSFLFMDDATGWRIAELLSEKSRAGVSVRVICDGYASPVGEEMFRFLRDAGVEVRVLGGFLSDQPLNKRWHQKSLIVDGQTAIQGGMNIANEYSHHGGSWIMRWQLRSTGWRDTDLRIAGPAVLDSQRNFLTNWAMLGSPLSESEVREAQPRVITRTNGVHARVVQNQAYENDQRDIEDLYVLAIDEAKTSITIENAYFVPTERIRNALMAAAERGVKVRVATNSVEVLDLPNEGYVARYWYEEMIAAGIEIREMTKRMNHSKTAAFDSTYAIVGSANLNRRSFNHDSEVVVGVRDAATAISIETHYRTLENESIVVTQQQLDDRSWLSKLWTWFLHVFLVTFM